MSLVYRILVNGLNPFLEKKVIENILCSEILSSGNRHSQRLIMLIFIDLSLNTGNVKLKLLFLDHDFILPRKFIKREKSLLDCYLQLFTVWLDNVFDVYNFLQFQWVQQWVNRLYFFALELRDRERIYFFDVEDFSCLYDLIVQLF